MGSAQSRVDEPILVKVALVLGESQQALEGRGEV